MISKLDRKYEYTHWVPSRKIGICYEKYESNLNDEKIQLLAVQDDVTSLYITDIANDGCWGQYPEFGIKVQNAQGYYALLAVDEMTLYEDATLKIVRYEKSDTGIWTQIDVCEEKLSEYYFDEQKKLCLRGECVCKRALDKSNTYYEKLEAKQREIEEEMEALKREKEAREAELREADLRKAKAVEEKKIEIKKALENLDAIEITIEKARRNGVMVLDGEFEDNVFVTKTQNFDQDICIVVDEFNTRLIKCEKCGVVKKEWDFYSYGAKSPTKGVCLICKDKRR